MKRHFSLMTLLLCLFVGGGMFSSCSKDEKKDGPKEITSPFTSVTAVDGTKTTSAVISDADKTIKFAMEELTDVSKVSITINVAPGVLLKTPAQATSTVNLTSPVKVTVHNGMKEVTYMMTATPKVVPMPVLTAKVGATDAAIDGQSITISYKPEMGDINGITFDFTMKSGATIKSPVDKTFNLELAEGAPMVVTYEGSDFNYTVKATDYVDPLISNGWTDVTSSYAPLPAYIKVYKNENLLKNTATKSIGYISIMSAGKSTMNILGDGASAKKTIIDLSAANPNWPVLLVGISGDAPAQTMIRDGKFVQKASGIQSWCAIGQAKDNSYKMAWSQVIDEKFYAFPFRNGTEFTPRNKADGAVWEVQAAVSGIPMILWDGNILTAGQTLCNDGSNNNWYDGDARYARSGIGITKYGRVIAFCGQEVDGSIGLSMLEFAKVMKDAGCYSAMSLEGSGTPNMFVNQQPTAKNKYEAAKTKAVQAAIAFK